MKKIECVIMDWAGTAVDYGCFAPVAAFLKAFGSLQEYTTPIPGVIETIGELKKAGIKIGSTTGYTRAMMDVVLP